MARPTLDPTATPTLGSILERALEIQGVLVSGLVVDGSIADADGPVEVHNFFEGITDPGHPNYPYQFVAAHLNNKAAVANYYAVEQGLSLNVLADNIAFGIELAALITPTDASAAIAFIGVNQFSVL